MKYKKFIFICLFFWYFLQFQWKKRIKVLYNQVACLRFSKNLDVLGNHSSFLLLEMFWIEKNYFKPV